MTTQTKVDCGKCYGTGWLNYHLNVANGVCFACGGSGQVTAHVFHQTQKQKFQQAALYMLSWFEDSSTGEYRSAADIARNAAYYERAAHLAARSLFIVQDKEWSKRVLNRAPAHLSRMVIEAGNAFAAAHENPAKAALAEQLEEERLRWANEQKNRRRK